MSDAFHFEAVSSFSEPSNSNIRSICFNCDGGYCITASSDKTVKLWNPQKSIMLKSYHGHGQEVMDVHSSKDNSLIVSGSRDQVVFLWDVLTGQSIRRFRGHQAFVNCVKFNYDDSTVIVSGSGDNSVMCWDAKSRGHKPIQTMKDAKDSILTVAISDCEIITGSVDGRVRIYDMRRGQRLTDFIGKPVTDCYFSLDNMSYVCCSIGGPIRMMDKLTGSCLNTYTGRKNNNYKVQSCVSRDMLLISGSEDGILHFWNAIDAKLIKSVPSGCDYILTLAYSPKVKQIITASGSKIILWSMEA